jgi:hypothetical protein
MDLTWRPMFNPVCIQRVIVLVYEYTEGIE